MKKLPYFNIDCFKPTSDNWSGNHKIANDKRYEGGYVHVSLFPLGPNFKTYRVAVWGNDDRGMEYDTKDREQAFEIYHHVCEEQDVTMFFLEHVIGFKYA